MLPVLLDSKVSIKEFNNSGYEKNSERDDISINLSPVKNKSEAKEDANKEGINLKTANKKKVDNSLAVKSAREII